MKQSIGIIVAIVGVIGFFVVMSFVNRPEQTGEFNTYASDDGQNAQLSSSEGEARDLCVQHTDGISMHIHPVVTIIIDGEQVSIPANIGIDANCMRALHTHESDGKIHIEYPDEHEFMLGDFFANWGKTFNATQILDNVADDGHRVRMTVNGKESTEFENLVLGDLQQIVIHYEEVE